MEFQLHPSSGRASVRTWSLGEAGERRVVVLVGAVALLVTSLSFTAPVVLQRLLRHEARTQIARESRELRQRWQTLSAKVDSLRKQAIDAGDLLNRVAFLYGVSPARWPRGLDPEKGLLAAGEPEKLAAGLSRYLFALERGREILAEREREDPGLAARTPALLPLSGAVFEPAAFFGPRISPWTGEPEFFTGLDIAAPAGSRVVAAGAGQVVFAGRVRPSASGALWRFGNLVVLSHGPSGASLYGHLARIGVRRLQRVSRGDTIGSVGSTGWAMSPQLHYEYWRQESESLTPTDPLFTVLDYRPEHGALSLEKMLATSAPAGGESLPGLIFRAPQP